jgi:chemotaxis regulatin CheY-phosphate phosphatase CheZ
VRLKENKVAYSINDLVEMARALSEGDFDRQFEQYFQGELGQLASYLDNVRQTLQSICTMAGTSSYIIPEAASGVAEIYQHAEDGVNSILDVVDNMSVDQEAALKIMTAMSSGQVVGDADIQSLQEIAGRTRRGLMNVIGYLSFQDVLRQRVETVQGLIEKLEKRTLELLVQFKVKANDQVIKEGEGETALRDEVKTISGEIGLDQSLVDELLESLK